MGSYLRSKSPIEEQAHRFFTPFGFKKFQEQFGLAIQYALKEETCTTFLVRHHKCIQYNKHKVVWDGKVGNGMFGKENLELRNGIDFISYVWYIKRN